MGPERRFADNVTPLGESVAPVRLAFAERPVARVCRWRTLIALSVLLSGLLPAVSLADADARGLNRAEVPGTPAVFDADVNYAVVVGIDEYDHFGALHHAVDDADRLEALLQEQGYTVVKLTDYKANPTRILKALDTVARLATDDGQEFQGSVVFAFAGHGFREGGENYLATSETLPERRAATSLAVSEVKRALEESGVRQRVLFVDACRNVPGSRNAAAIGTGFEFDEEAEGAAVFYSTGKRSLAYEDPELGQGVFTHYLAKGLEGAAVDAHGSITFEGLRKYVERQVKNHVYRRFGQEQVPYISGERTGDFVLARVALPSSGEASPESGPTPLERPVAGLPPPPFDAQAGQQHAGGDELALTESEERRRRADERDALLFTIDAELDALHRHAVPRPDTIDKVLAYAALPGHSIRERDERLLRVRDRFERAIRYRIDTADLARVPDSLDSYARIAARPEHLDRLRDAYRTALLSDRLAAIDRDILDERFTQPAGRNALERLTTLRREGVGERDVRERYRRISFALVQRIDRSIRDGDFAAAEATLSELEGVPGQAPAVRQLTRSLAQARERDEIGDGPGDGESDLPLEGRRSRSTGTPVPELR